MIYRKRIYKVYPNRAEAFTQFFQEYLLPNQLKQGAKLVGRWVNADRTEIIAIWQYESMEHYQAIQQQVVADPLHQLAQQKRKELAPLYSEVIEEFIYDTLDQKTWRSAE